jgi:hypothetical protein
MKNILCCLVTLYALRAAGQSGHLPRFEKLQNPDSLQIGLSAMMVSGDSAFVLTDTCTLEYDPVNQYPYYSIRACTSYSGDSVFCVVNIQRFPEKGNLLLYWLDGENTPRFLASLSVSEGAASNQQLWRIPLLKGSTGYFVVILSSQPFKDPENLIAGLEFTYGSFIFRQREVLGSGQIPALPQWRLFQNNYTGVEWEPSLLQSEQLAWLPVVFTIQRN